MSEVQVKVPDIGDFDEVAVIEVLVKAGDTVKAEQSLITVESDKASMEIPSSAAGVVKSVAVKIGDKVKEGSVVLTLDAVEGAAAAPAAAPAPAPAAAAPKQAPAAATSAPAAASSYTGAVDFDCDLDFFHHTGGRRRNLHRRLVRFHGDERLLGLDRVAHLHQHLDHRDFIEIADVRHLDFHCCHIVCLPP